VERAFDNRLAAYPQGSADYAKPQNASARRRSAAGLQRVLFLGLYLRGAADLLAFLAAVWALSGIHDDDARGAR